MTDEAIRIAVFIVPTGTLRRPCGQSREPRPVAENVSGEESAEEHDLGSEEEPDADLCVPKTGVRTSRYRVRNFHVRLTRRTELVAAWTRGFVRLLRPVRFAS